MQDKEPRNAEGKRHGFWELYYSNGQLCSKGDFLNDLAHGSWERYHSNGQLWFKGNLIKGERIGYNQRYYSDGSINETKFYAR